MKEFFIYNHKNIKLNVIEGRTNENSNIKGILVNIHGIGSHFQKMGEKFDNFDNRDKFFSQIFDNNYYKSYALEFHGHGKSDGERCCIYDFNDLVEDINTLINYIKNIYKNKKIFIIAESMGGNAAIQYSMKYPRKVNGYILLSPMCGIDDSLIPTCLTRKLLLFLSTYFPEYPLVHSFDPKNSSRNLEYHNDKINCQYNYDGKIKLSTARECFHASLKVKKKSILFSDPVYIIHSKIDKVTKSEISEFFYYSCSSVDKRINILEDSDHLVLVNKDDEDDTPNLIMCSMLNWLNKR